MSEPTERSWRTRWHGWDWMSNVEVGTFSGIVLKLRKRMPRGLRQVLRLARHVAARGHQSSPQLPPALVTDCRVCASRIELLKHLPHSGRVAEVGVEHGYFSQRILADTHPSELHLIDLDFGNLDPSLRGDTRVRIHQGLSHQVLASFPDAGFDWIYIDADHSYAAVKRDAEVAASKVKPGGFLVFNDFAHRDPFLGSYGVHRAVTEFATNHQWPLVWLAYEVSALYDVALRRPDKEPGP